MEKYKYNSLYELIENNAKNYPKEIMLFVDDKKVTHLEIKKQVDSIASYLQLLGIEKSDRVALIVGNSLEFIISFFAILKLGAVVVPINTLLKKEEFEYILNDCQAKLIFSSSKFQNETKDLLSSTTAQKIIWIDEAPIQDHNNIFYNEILNANNHILEDVHYLIEDWACIIYTSGTTGKPKGAVLSHKNFMSNLLSVDKVVSIKKNERFIVYLPMFHAYTLSTTILLPFYFAKPLVVIRTLIPFSNIIKQVLFKRVTIFVGVPDVYKALAKAKLPWYFLWFNSVRIFVSGASALSNETLKQFNNKFKKAVMLEGYGLSECSPFVAVNRVEKQKQMSVGPALYGYEVKIVDEEMIELPIGEVGEIIVKGDNVMVCYLNKPEATNEVIVNGWLKTGDLGRVDEDGFIYIMDRKKDLIISKGQNIYPREIEEVLNSFESIDSSAVIGVFDEHSGEAIVAFVQIKEGFKSNELEIKKFLKKHIANFKIPKHIYFIDELPKNATGKVLKRVLKENLK